MTENAPNPFESPTSSEATAAPPGLPAGAKRPASPMVFGVIALVFSTLGFLGSIAGAVMNFAMETNPEQQEMMQRMGQTEAYMIVTMAIGLVICAVEAAAGVQLVRYKLSGRLLFNVYAALVVVTTIGNSIYTFPKLMSIIPQAGGPEASVASGVVVGSVIFGTLITLVFPVLGLIFLNRRGVVDSLR